MGDVATPGGEAEHRVWCWDMEDSYSPRETPHQAGGTGVWEPLVQRPTGGVLGRKLQRGACMQS